MPVRRFFTIVVFALFPLVMLVESCGERHVCEGLNNRTGSANTSRNARKGNRGGYKSPREVEARDRQRKRVKHHSKQSGRKSHGGGNTTGGHRGFSGSGSYHWNLDDAGNTSESGQVRY